ncbi:MAG: LuxR C-terminal-related transcriptional regulator [Propionicimonas sp.]
MAAGRSLTLHTALRDETVTLLAAGISVDLFGMPGSGRSLLLRSIVDAMGDQGLRAVSVRGVAALRERPLEALAIAGLIGRREIAKTSTAVAGAVAAVSEALRDGRSVLVVDDSDSLDDVSAGVLVAAHAEQRFPLLSVTRMQPRSARVPHQVPPEIQPGVTLLVPALGYVETQILLAGVLDGAIDSGVVGRVFTASGGLPGIALALVDGARRSGSLHRSSGVWRAGAELWTPGVLRALEPLIRPLSTEEVDALHALALAGVVELSTARRLVSWEVLDTLDGYGLLRFPLHGEEVLVGVYPPVLAERFWQFGVGARYLKVNESLAVALGGTGIRLPPAPSALSIVSGDDGGIPLALSASDTVVNRLLIENWHRETLVRRSEWETAPSPRTGMEYLRTLLITGAPMDTIDAVIENTPRVGERRAIIRFDNWSALAVGLVEQDQTRVATILDRARLTADEWLPVVDAMHAHISLVIDRTAEPESLALPQRGTSAEVRAIVDAVRAELLVSRGRPAEALDLLGWVEWSEDALGQVRLAAYGLALLMEGRFDEALEWATGQLPQARRRNDLDSITILAFTAAAVYETQLRRTELRSLLSSVLSSAVYSALARPAEEGLLTIASSVALIEARPNAARNLAEQARSLGHGPSWYALTSPTYTLAQLDGAGLAAGEVRRLVADRLWAEYEELLSRNHFSSALSVGMLAVSEHPDPARARALQKFAATIPAALARHFEVYAAACASADPAEALAAGDLLVEAGAAFFAVRAYAAAVDGLHAGGDPSRASEVHNAARARLFRISPEAADALDAALAPRLTAREFEIACLAADGASNQTIAERLSLSVRTVENHLHRAYRKLGVDNRSELSTALGR